MTKAIKGKINSSYTHLKENAFDKRKVTKCVRREKQRSALTQERRFQIQSSKPQSIVDKSAEEGRVLSAATSREFSLSFRLSPLYSQFLKQPVTVIAFHCSLTSGWSVEVPIKMIAERIICPRFNDHHVDDDRPKL